MKKLVWCACAAVALTAVAFGEEAISLSYASRQFPKVSTDFVAQTEKTGSALPSSITESLLFAFDCSKTNGWTFSNGNQVLKIPNLVPGSDRFLTASGDDIGDEYYYGAYRIYYGDKWKIKSAAQ